MQRRYNILYSTSFFYRASYTAIATLQILKMGFLDADKIIWHLKKSGTRVTVLFLLLLLLLLLFSFLLLLLLLAYRCLAVSPLSY